MSSRLICSLPALLAIFVVLGARPAHAEPSLLDGDPRLDAKVTVHWKKETLYDGLAKISRKTGARLVPDRALVDEPVMVAATDVPARELLEQIASLLHFRWGREHGETKDPRYLLYQDATAKQEEQDELDRGKRAVLEALRKLLDRCRAMESLSPEQLQQASDQADQKLLAGMQGGMSPDQMTEFQAAKAASSPTSRAMLDLVEQLAPGDWDALSSGDALVFSTRPEAGERPLPAGTAGTLRGSTPRIPYPKALFSALGPQVVEGVNKAEELMQDRWTKGDGFKVTVQMNLATGAQPIGWLRAIPEPGGSGELGPIFSLAGLSLYASGVMPEEKKEDPAERERRLSADLLLGKKATLSLPPLPPRSGILALIGKGYRAGDVLPAVESAYGVKIFGDAYTRGAAATVNVQSGAELPLYQVLDRIAGTSRKWERDGNTIRFRSLTWAFDRRGEVPVRYMRRWLAIRARNGRFSLDDMAEMVTVLRDEQVESLIFSAMEAGTDDITDFVMVSANRQPLRFYGKLIPMQRRWLLTGHALPAAELFPYQQALLLDMNRQQNQSLFSSFGFGVKPPRSPSMLARAVISMERKELKPPAAAAPAGAPEKPGPELDTLRIAFPNGQKDEYGMIIGLSGVIGGAPAPAAPTSAAPAAPAPAGGK